VSRSTWGRVEMSLDTAKLRELADEFGYWASRLPPSMRSSVISSRSVRSGATAVGEDPSRARADGSHERPWTHSGHSLDTVTLIWD
jgi:hypothetical protein